MLQQLWGIWHYLVATLTVLLAVAASAHAILRKRDSRAAVLWVGFIWLVPFFGALLYFLLGVNRIRRQAALLRAGVEHLGHQSSANRPIPLELIAQLEGSADHLIMLARLVNNANSRPLVTGNRIQPLLNGDEAFPAMIQAINRARRSVTLATYIFDRGHAGQGFVEALAAAVRRGVEVRVLIDDTGARYSWPSIVPLLHQNNVPVARFLPTYVPLRIMAINLRNHRKILVVDGHTAFTGGMNIRDGNLLQKHPWRPVQDIQFQIEGPVVAHLQQVFAEDWSFTTREILRGEKWFPPLEPCGDVIARGIADGPDEDFERLRWTLLGALSTARESVRIVNPYFLPDQALISALNVAAMRGVTVDIILPGVNNLPFVQWATFAVLWQMLEFGCRVWLTPPPFDHSKLMIVDGHWSLLGSANCDPRSLRLNFELDLECYDPALARRLDQIIEGKLKSARRLTLKNVDTRGLHIKLRDGVARLFTPFL